MIKNKAEKLKNKRKSGRFSSMLMGYYILFSLLLVVLLFLFLVVAQKNADKYYANTKVSGLADAYSQTAISKYNGVDYKHYLGDDGYVQILDSNNNVIFDKNKGKISIDYTADILKLIPSYDVEQEISIKSSKTNTGKKVKKIQRIGYGTEGDVDLEQYNYVDIVDSERNVIYSSQLTSKKKYTESEYKVLTGKLENSYEVCKKTFKSNSGKKLTLIAFEKKDYKATVSKVDRVYIMTGIGFALAFILMVLLFGMWIGRKVKKPLKALESVMKEITTGRSGGQIDYRGSREFMDMCSNFNSMSTALYNSEMENQRLQSENQQLVSDISHDLKTPITVIQGYSKAICDGMVAPEDMDKYLQIIADKSDALTELIDEFHDYSKISHPDYSYDLIDCNICEYTREYFASRFDELEIAGYNINVNIPEEKIMVRLDISRFKRVYGNIVNNFMKYNKPGKTLSCMIESDDISVTIYIGDNGKGIAKGVRDTIFKPFVKGEASRNTKGSGLGLSIVKKIVESHNGTVRLVEKPHKGLKTEFAIRLLRLS